MTSDTKYIPTRSISTSIVALSFMSILYDRLIHFVFKDSTELQHHFQAPFYEILNNDKPDNSKSTFSRLVPIFKILSIVKTISGIQETDE